MKQQHQYRCYIDCMTGRRRIFHIIGQHLVDFARKKAKGIYVMYLLIYLHGQL